GESQRKLLRARSQQRQFPARETVRQSELDEWLHAERPPDSDATIGWPADVSRQSRRHELVFAVVQPEHRAVLSVNLGRLRIDLHPAAGGVPGGSGIWWWCSATVHARARSACRANTAARRDQQLD